MYTYHIICGAEVGTAIQNHACFGVYFFRKNNKICERSGPLTQCSRLLQNINPPYIVRT